MKVKTDNKPMHPLRRIRKDFDLTQGELGSILGATGTLIAQIEGCHQNITRNMIKEVCENFDIEPGKLMQDLEDYQERKRAQLISRVRELH